ncbi:uncharacterized protein LOC100371856 [Saccoglossus kowalevskii]
MKEMESQLDMEKTAKEDIELRYETATRRLEKIARELDDESDARRQLDNSYKERERVIRSLQYDLKETKRRLEHEADIKHRMETEKMDLQKKIESYRKEEERQTTNSHHVTDRLNLIERRNTELEKQLRIETEANHRLKKNNSEVQKNFSMVEHAHNDLQEKYKQVIEAKLSLERELITVQSSLDTEKGATQSTQDLLSELEARNKALQVEMLSMKQKEAKLSSDLQKHQENILVLEKAKANTEFELKSFQHRYDQAVLEHKAQLASISAERRRFDRTKEEHNLELVADMKLKLTEETMARQQAESKWAEDARQRSILQVELRQAEQQLQRVDEQRKTSEEKVKQLTLQLEQEAQRRTLITNDYKSVSQEVAKLRLSEKQYKKEQTELKELLKSQDEKVEKIKHNLALNELQMKELQDQFEAEQYFSTLYKTQVRELKEEVDERANQTQDVQDTVNKLQNARDSLMAQLELTLTKADSEQLARSIAEGQYADLEKEKTMLEMEMEQMRLTHKSEMNEKNNIITMLEQEKNLHSFVIFLPHLFLSFCFVRTIPPSIGYSNTEGDFIILISGEVFLTLRALLHLIGYPNTEGALFIGHWALYLDRRDEDDQAELAILQHRKQFLLARMGNLLARNGIQKLFLERTSTNQQGTSPSDHQISDISLAELRKMTNLRSQVDHELSPYFNAIGANKGHEAENKGPAGEYIIRDSLINSSGRHAERKLPGLKSPEHDLKYNDLSLEQFLQGYTLLLQDPSMPKAEQ